MVLLIGRVWHWEHVVQYGMYLVCLLSMVYATGMAGA